MQNVDTKTFGRDGRRQPQKPNPSPFLSKLPPEIRNLIYQHILTSHNIHIDCRFLANAVVHPSERLNLYTVNGKPWGISATICSAPGADAEAYMQTKVEKQEDSHVEHYEDRHADCLRPARGAARRNVPIALLQTCKQIHDEAVGYLYADNTFSFKTPEDMDLFVSIALSPTQRSWIRKIHLHCETTRYRDPFSTLTSGTVKELTDLRYFGLSVADYYKSWGMPQLPALPTGRLERVEVLIGPKPRHARGTRTGSEAWRNRGHAVEWEGRLLEGRG